MEKYVNEDTIIKTDAYEIIKDNLLCPICKHLMVEPVICLNCQNTLCKKCSENLKAKGQNCPYNCENSILKDVIGKNNLITKFKYRCIKGCGEELSFNDIEKHYNSKCCLKKIKTLTPQQAAEYKKKYKKEIPFITSKLKIK